MNSKKIKFYLALFFFIISFNYKSYAIKVQCPVDIDEDGISDDPNAVCIHIAAGDGFVNMADGRLQYVFGFRLIPAKLPNKLVMDYAMLGATFPAPTIKVKEGQDLYLTLSNVGMVMRPDLFDPHTVHWHGFPNAASIFDGVPDASIAVNMGASITYYYHAHEPGTYMYHCHVEATEHMEMGMLGNIWVTPKQDGTPIEYPKGSGKVYTKFAYNDGDGSTGYDVDYPVQFHSFDAEFHDANLNVQPLPFETLRTEYAMFNGRGYPDTTKEEVLLNSFNGKGSQNVPTAITAHVGERILLRMSNLSVSDFFTVTALGIPMTIVGKDARLLRSTSGENLYIKTNSVTLGGGEAADVILDTEGVPPGKYFLYTTNLQYLCNYHQERGGMMTEINLLP